MSAAGQRGAALVALALAAALRLPALDRIPNGLIPDEALSAYDAFSIVRTGRDAAGERLPLFPRSTARLHCLNIYATVPFVAARGLDVWAARLPAALSGVAGVGLLFLLLRDGFSPAAGLCGAALLAVSPWHVLLSRTGYDWVMLPSLTTLTAWLAMRALTRDASFVPAGVAAGVSLYGYAPLRLLLPLLLAALAATHAADVRREWRRALPGLVALVLLAAPVAAISVTGEGRQRLASIVEPGQAAWPAARAAGLRVAASFSPSFLLVPVAAPELHRLRSSGLVYGFEAGLAAAGALVCLAWRRRALLPLLLFAVAPVAVAIHRDAPDPILGVVLLPWLQALAGIGAAWLLGRGWRSGPLGRAALLAGCAWAGASVGRMALDLYREFPVYAAPVWTHGVGETVRAIERLRPDHADVIVDTEQKLIGSLILFYTRYDPAQRQREVLALPGRAERARADGYLLASLADAARATGRRLVWTTAERARRAPPGATPLLRVPFPDGRPNYVVLELGSEPPQR